MKDYEKKRQDYLPPFPRTPHLKYNPNLDKDDILVEHDDVFNHELIVEEKVDGTNIGILAMFSEPIIRNKDRILNKGNIKNTAAKKQYAPIWNWYYENKDKFVDLPYVVYGEWMWAKHGIDYTNLPDYFIAFDLYDYENKFFLDPNKTRNILQERGFIVPPLLFKGKVKTYEELAALYECKSEYSKDLREGVYIKIGDGQRMTYRYKMVRPDYVRGKFWNPDKLTKNNLKN